LIEIRPTIGSSLGKRRLELELEKGQAAEKIGMSRTTYSSYERDTQRPSVDVFPALAEFLGVDMEDFLVLYGATCIAAARASLVRAPAEEGSPEHREISKDEHDSTFESEFKEPVAAEGGFAEPIDTLEAPDTPDVPDEHDVPKAPEVPDVPDIPDVPEVPEVPSTPETPNVPAPTRVPEVPRSPEIAEVTSISEILDAPHMPMPRYVPEISRLLDPSKMPEVFGVPDYLETPESSNVTEFYKVRESSLADFRESSPKKKKKKKKGKDGKK
jgi:transcriptional regulator with XRE-family HTH domain